MATTCLVPFQGAALVSPLVPFLIIIHGSVPTISSSQPKPKVPSLESFKISCVNGLKFFL